MTTVAIVSIAAMEAMVIVHMRWAIRCKRTARARVGGGPMGNISTTHLQHVSSTHSCCLMRGMLQTCLFHNNAFLRCIPRRIFSKGSKGLPFARLDDGEGLCEIRLSIYRSSNPSIRSSFLPIFYFLSHLVNVAQITHFATTCNSSAPRCSKQHRCSRGAETPGA